MQIRALLAESFHVESYVFTVAMWDIALALSLIPFHLQMKLLHEFVFNPAGFAVGIG